MYLFKNNVLASHYDFTHDAFISLFLSVTFQLPVILKIRRLNRTVVQDSVSMFVEYTLAAWIMGSMGLSMMCIF